MDWLKKITKSGLKLMTYKKNLGMRMIGHALCAMLMVVLCQMVHAQGTSYYEDTQFDPFQRKLYFVGRQRPHTTIRSYDLDELRQFYNLDSLIYSGMEGSWKMNTRFKVFNDFFNDDFLSWRKADSSVYVAINPMFDLSMGVDKNQTEAAKTWVNSRGFYINGNLGRNFWFYCDFSENQAVYADYYNNLTDSLKVVPGQSNYKKANRYAEDYDFQVANGYISFNIGKYVNLLVGKTKTFVGDGYRSLLLGDASCAVPTFRLNLKILKAKYTMMVTQLRASETVISNDGQRTKYSFSHFLDWNMGRRVTLGVFENVTQCTWRKSGGYRGIDLEYLNPFIIFRPGEYNAGSPDKMLVGATGKVVCTNWLTVYGQIMFNEFRIKELFGGNDYWSNKYGFQFGIKTFDIFKVDGLDVQLEYNQIRPFCYSQYDAMGNYTHHKQSMAHPLGANLREGIGIVNYHHGRIAARMQVNVTQYGDDFPGDTISYGHNPNIASMKRNSQYGVKMQQGLKTDLRYFDLSAAYIINPRNMMNVTAGVRIRKRTSERTNEESKNFYVSLRWSLKSHYYDY